MARILIVDDEPSLRLVLQRTLEIEGYEVVSVADGFRAMTWLRQESPDLVLLDMRMPEMSGVEVVRWMRKNYRTASVPVIFLTARVGQQERLDGLLAGANDYITKPYEKDELLTRIRNTLDLQRMQRQASPLTGLPGNQAIEDVLADRIARGVSFAFLYVDVDNFKSYNDYYGYQRGDHAICRLADAMCKALEAITGGSGFVGHVGGDDFVALTEVGHGRGLAEDIVLRFDRMVPALYDPADAERGYVEVASRRGKPERFPLLTVTVAVVRDPGGVYEHVGSIGAVVSELKQYGKARKGSQVVTDRRIEPKQRAENG
jgi:diguanylate cyclase (GGDEF)-like protein